MMVKNLCLQINEGGFIKIGEKGTQIKSANGVLFNPPQKLDHFRITTTERDSNGNYVIDENLQNILKKDPAYVNQNGDLVKIPIRLLYDDPELNFPNRYMSYVSGALSCYGDGESSFKRIDDYKVKHPCPCIRLDPGYDGKDKCKISAVLTAIIDEAGLFGSAHKFRTTSMNSVKGILGGLKLIMDATKGRISGLPLLLTLNARNTVSPTGQNTVIYIASICYRGNMQDLRNAVIKMLTEEKQYLIGMDEIIDVAAMSEQNIIVKPGTEEEREFVEEFFPHAAVEPVIEETIATKPADPVTTEQTGSDQVKNAQTQTTKTEQEPFDTGSEPTAEKPAEDLPGILVPVGQYKKIYEAFKAEKNFDKAMSLAKRLQKGNLLYWLANTYSDIEFEPNIKKPETLELIENVLRSTLLRDEPGQVKEDDKPVDPASDEPTAAKPTNPPPVQSYVEDDGKEYIQSWDDSGTITKDQLRRLVQLKIALEKQGTLQPNKWVQHVNFFLDATGKEINTAVNLTTVQGDTFIRMLEANLKTEEIAA